MQESAEWAFQEYGIPLETFTYFKYLGRVLTAGDDNWLAVLGKLKKARKSWARTTRILGREGTNPRVSGIFFKEVVQSVLLFRLKTWVLTSHMGRALGSFQHRFARRIMGIHPRRQEEWGWEYPQLVAVLEEAGFEEIGVYILKRQNMVAQYIVKRPILDLCERLVRRPGVWIYWGWWEKEGLELTGEREWAEVAADGE